MTFDWDSTIAATQGNPSASPVTNPSQPTAEVGGPSLPVAGVALGFHQIDQLLLGMDKQLAVHVAHMGLHRLLGQAQLLADHALVAAAGKYSVTSVSRAVRP